MKNKERIEVKEVKEVKEAKDIKGLDVKIWMLRNGLTIRKICRGYGCNDAVVFLLINGKRTSRGIVKYLISLGCK